MIIIINWFFKRFQEFLCVELLLSERGGGFHDSKPVQELVKMNWGVKWCRGTLCAYYTMDRVGNEQYG